MHISYESGNDPVIVTVIYCYIRDCDAHLIRSGGGVLSIQSLSSDVYEIYTRYIDLSE